MSEVKKLRITHLNPFTKSMHSKRVQNDGCREDTLDCPETLVEFEQIILDLFEPAAQKDRKLN